ncbi:hypothetical protein [Streptosporangium subroseum]|uniref:hypothetical protein n=1 Tax=Streptosporangium subroseum TaxID=106412 RepID=UPI0030869BC3|nr:hypothetical protein OHB15_14405 [Streptosporangium subroseum]
MSFDSEIHAPLKGVLKHFAQGHIWTLLPGPRSLHQETLLSRLLGDFVNSARGRFENLICAAPVSPVGSSLVAADVLPGTLVVLAVVVAAILGVAQPLLLLRTLTPHKPPAHDDPLTF